MVPIFTHSFIHHYWVLAAHKPWGAKPQAISALTALQSHCWDALSPEWVQMGQNSKSYSIPRGPETELSRTTPAWCPILTHTQGDSAGSADPPRDRKQVHWPTQKGLMCCPHVWRIPWLLGLKGTLRTNWIHFSASEKDCICILLWQRDSARETHFKNLVKQSLYLQTGGFKGIQCL